MINVYAGGVLAYDSRLEEYDLMALQTTSGLNKSGTLALTMGPGHPAYNLFTSYKTVVTLYDNGVRKFRGRALYPSEDMYQCRTITCEGEYGFFMDAIMRPYLYQDTPAAIFTDALALYNAQVDDFKRFTLGEVTVTDANDYVRLESESAETFADFFGKLLERCGGYITFTDDGNGGSIINWLAEVGGKSAQRIEFGENLLEFAQSGQSDELATALVPYGAQLEDGTRVTIESVNDGLDYIEDATAVALRGRITATVTWDDVTEPANLLKKAKEWLAEHKLSVTSLQLTALDLSRIDRTVDSYTDGDYIPVYSKPHGLDDYFQLTDRTTDWLNPDKDTINLGKTHSSLTGSDVKAEQDINAKIVILNTAVINGKLELQNVERTLTSKIEQTSTKILLEISESYATKTYLSSQLELLAGSISLEVSGALGNSAAIRLNVNGESYTETLDLSDVRKAFADDPSTITLEAGTITFNSNTLRINSSYFTLDSEGKITATSGHIGALRLTDTGIYSFNLLNNNSYAGWYKPANVTGESICFFAGASDNQGTGAKFFVRYNGSLYAGDAQLNGSILSVDKPYITSIQNGSLMLMYDDGADVLLCGTVNTKYWSGASSKGISLRIEEDGDYLMFSHYDPDTGSGYSVDYVLNYGWGDNYEEKHIFQTSARFLARVVTHRLDALNLCLLEGSPLKVCDYDGNVVGGEMLKWSTTNDCLVLGHNSYDTVLCGTTVYLKNTGTTVTSDRNAKNSIEALPEAYEAFVDALQPVRYKYNEGTSDRYHVGFIAQDVEAALTAAGLTTQDFAGYVNIGGRGELGLQYDEFIAILLQKIKRLEQRVTALQAVE